MPVLQIYKQKHICDLEKLDEYCLPQLPPQFSRTKKWLHQLRRHFTVSSTNIRCEFVYRSIYTVKSERRRQLKRYPWFIIHPFSSFSMIVEMVMAIVWMLVFFKDPVIIAFQQFDINILRDPMDGIDLVLDILNMCYIPLCFITGYYHYNTKEVILGFNEVWRHYLQTYFFFDLLGSCPMVFIYKWLINHISTNDKLAMFLCVFRVLRLVRFKSMLYSLRQITYRIKISDANHSLLSLLIISLYAMHWGSCILIVCPRFYRNLYNQGNPKSWTSSPQLKININNEFHMYLWATYVFMLHFLNIGTMNLKFLDSLERTVVTAALLLGWMFFGYSLTVLLVSASQKSSSANKYEEMLHNLMEYAKRKRFPLVLRAKLRLYYEHRFQKHYFKESDILESIAPHMRYQITLHSCKYLLDKMKLFHGLSKTVLGTIIGSLKYEVFLPRDVIMTPKDFERCVYFVAYGTVALYNLEMIELHHMTDGEFFGITLLLEPSMNLIGAAIAVETTEIYRLEEVDFLYCYSNYDDFHKKIKIFLHKIIEYLRHMEKQITELKVKQDDIIFDLRRGKIIEKNKSRKNELL